jgi:predicted pyridoxine 5'-phosphate oxidase superfamily flavin-nucleotide-binding protein
MGVTALVRAFTRLAYTSSVRAVQSRLGAREHNERVAGRPPERADLPDEMQARLRRANSIIIGTASLEGWPHLQHRGGPRGFIKVLDPRHLAFADYSGNRQYITVGNLAENDRALLLLMDYAARTRLKIWGRATVLENDPVALEVARDPDYPARVERVIRIAVEAWDTNCNSHIPHLLPADGDTSG